MPSHRVPRPLGSEVLRPEGSGAEGSGAQEGDAETLRPRAALLTGPTRGAVATLAVSGAGVGAILAKLLRPATATPILAGQVRYADWHGGAAEKIAGESVVVTRSDADPRLEPLESWEIHCHGGAAAAARLLDDLRRVGVEIVSAADGRLTSGGEDATDSRIVREATAVLLQTESRRTAAIALDQIRGGLRAFVERGLAVDPSGLGPEWLDRQRQQARQILARAELGRHLHRPWRVVLAGKPNVGKSSLINSLLGYRRSITMDQPGTTRDVLEARTVIDGWPIRLSDTAGIRGDADSPIERAGIAAAGRELAEADLVLWVEDAADFTMPLSTWKGSFGPSSTPPESTGDGARRTEGSRELRVINKIDRLPDREFPDSRALIATSATTGEGIDALRQRIVEWLIPDIPPPGEAVPLSPRQETWLRQIAEATDAAACQRAIWQLGYEAE